MPIKAPTLLMAASLAANAALVALVAIEAPSAFRMGSAGGAGAPAAAPAPTPVSANGTEGPRTWSAIRSGDLKAQAGRLRAAGFPPNIVRAILREQLNERFAPRRRELAAQLGARPYWTSRFDSWDSKTMAGMNAINKEQANMLKDLMGAETEPGDPFGDADRLNRSGSLGPEKYARVQAILSDYNELKGEIYSAAQGGPMLPEDQEKLAYLEKEQQADIAASLTPDELFEYQIRNSPTAGMLRYSLHAFNPTEDEFRAIFRVQQAFDQQYGSMGPLSPDQQRERQAHKADVAAQVQDILGPDRFAEYKRDTDPAYQAVSRLVERLDLPPAAAQQVVALQDDISKRADAIRKDQSLAAADRSSQLAALADEATSKVASVLGDRGLAAYKQTGG
ncbi:MAG TPA: hypothetical protein VN775_11990 [Opitutaceae bacterium]|nr:hypothetical protein [Opitutaceae bacterium]